jgi:hypothetical protein
VGQSRRKVLQSLGLALAGWGTGDLGIWATHMARVQQRYQAALAAPTTRKLALLVGINRYGGVRLAGCLTDVEMQRELLVHRFGFAATDVMLLTEQQATRGAIAQAFVEHLGQAQSGDVVLFHFSGFGRLKLLGQPLRQFLLADTPEASPGGLDEAELSQWARSLNTTNVTTVLDTSYAYQGQPLQGNLRVRSRPTLPTPSTSQLEPATPSPPSNWETFPGLVLMAAAPGQVATETRWSGFDAGLFTYALTQSLWQTIPASRLRVVLGRTADQISQLTQQQQPRLNGQKTQATTLSPYLLPTVGSGADGAITAIADNRKTLQVWLGGLMAAVLEQCGDGSVLAVVPSMAATGSAPLPTLLQLVARRGLEATATVIAPLREDATIDLAEINLGQPVQEWVRRLPSSIGLTVALDASLERIERVDAVSALSAIPYITTAIAGEQPADYVFSKLPLQPITQIAALPTTSPTDLSNERALGLGTAPSAYGLFSSGRDLLPDTLPHPSTAGLGENGEAVKAAVRRLTPKLQTLLATKLINLTVNERTSRLGIRATVLALTSRSPQPLIQRFTLRVTAPAKGALPAIAPPAEAVPVALGSRIQYQVENYGQQPVYPLLLALDSTGTMVLLHLAAAPNAEPATTPPSDRPLSQRPLLDSDATGLLVPPQTLNLPTALDAGWSLQTPGQLDAYLICSTDPFRQTLAALSTTATINGSLAVGEIANPVEVVQAILQDLHRPNPWVDADAIALDVNRWATLRFTLQVV